MGLLRFFFATGVVLTHAGIASDEYARLMVTLFFVYSGYIVSENYNINYKLSVKRFYIRRIGKLYSLHFVVSAFILLFYSGRVFEHSSFWDYAISLTLVFGYSGLINGPAWTLSYEIMFYILFPTIFLLKKNIYYIIILYITFVIYNIHAGSEPISPFAVDIGPRTGALLGIYYSVIESFSNFILGFMIWCLSKKGITVGARYKGRHIVFILSLYLFVNIIILYKEYSVGAVFYLISFVPVVCLFVLDPSKEPRWSRTLGAISFPVYLIHWPLLQYVFPGTIFHQISKRSNEIFVGMDQWSNFIFALVLSFLLGVCWIRIEAAWRERYVPRSQV